MTSIIDAGPYCISFRDSFLPVKECNDLFLLTEWLEGNFSLFCMILRGGQVR